ncbi:5'-nucleotidase-like [Amphibalanus amphitrite]|uniref:5'-nucleotidase-like n=1 Tax=Amphibalanus amphitrite TaxID=1232801 RepID=UPI001C916762|nr:5'-nucleotidase-like [Amphibalanus amphitrite]
MSRLLLLLLLASTTSLTSSKLHLSILHNNDIHSHFDPVSGRTTSCRPPEPCYGGIGRLVKAVNTFKDSVPNTLLLYGGDIFQGHLYYTLFKWTVMADMMNMVPYDAMALGNHEFDDDLEGLLPYMENISHPLLCTNIDFGGRASEVTDRCLSSLIREMDGYKIGIMGYTTPETPELAPVTSSVQFSDEIAALQLETRRLQAAGAQIIIAVGHSGYPREKEMAAEIDGIDVIVGGHSHSLLYNGTAPDDNPVDGPYPTVIRQPSGRTVLVVQAYQYGKYLGVLNVTFDGAGEVEEWSGEPMVLDGDRDEEAERRLEGYRGQIRIMEAQVIGRTLVHLVGDRTVCRFRECNLGNLIADGALRRCLMVGGQGWSQVTAAIVNSGGIRESIPPGNITQADVQQVHPFGNTLNVVTLSGVTLKKVFEHSVSRHGDGKGRFLQVAGIRVTYDLSRPTGSRIVSLEVLCANCTVPKLEPVVDNVLYRVAVPKFIAEGGDGFKMIREEKLAQVDIGALDAAVLRSQVIRFSPVIAGLEDRIRFIEPTAPGSGASVSATVSSALLVVMILLLRVC